MKLYLVRHAIAETRDSALWPDDAERPLTGQGVKRMKKAARGLQSIIPDVDVVLSSPFERAWHTANILSSKGWPSPAACEELTRDDPDALLRALEPYSSAGSIVLVGHESLLSRFAVTLLGWPRVPWTEIKKGGVLCLDLKQLIRGAGAELEWLLPPKVLRALG